MVWRGQTYTYEWLLATAIYYPVPLPSGVLLSAFHHAELTAGDAEYICDTIHRFYAEENGSSNIYVTVRTLTAASVAE